MTVHVVYCTRRGTGGGSNTRVPGTNLFLGKEKPTGAAATNCTDAAVSLAPDIDMIQEMTTKAKPRPPATGPGMYVPIDQ